MKQAGLRDDGQPSALYRADDAKTTAAQGERNEAGLQKQDVHGMEKMWSVSSEKRLTRQMARALQCDWSKANISTSAHEQNSPIFATTHGQRV